jgi:hypothetical protein
MTDATVPVVLGTPGYDTFFRVQKQKLRKTVAQFERRMFVPECHVSEHLRSDGWPLMM